MNQETNQTPITTDAREFVLDCICPTPAVTLLENVNNYTLLLSDNGVMNRLDSDTPG